MEIKANRNLYRNILIAFSVLIIFIGTLSYFLGFDVNVKSLLYYGIFLISTMLLFFVIFLIIDKLNKKYIVFDEEKIIEKHKNKEEKIVLYFNQILYIKYHNKIDLLNTTIDFGYVEIAYKTDLDKEVKYFHLYLSKKNYKKIFDK